MAWICSGQEDDDDDDDDDEDDDDEDEDQGIFSISEDGKGNISAFPDIVVGCHDSPESILVLCNPCSSRPARCCRRCSRDGIHEEEVRRNRSTRVNEEGPGEGERSSWDSDCVWCRGTHEVLGWNCVQSLDPQRAATSSFCWLVPGRKRCLPVKRRSPSASRSPRCHQQLCSRTSNPTRASQSQIHINIAVCKVLDNSRRRI